MNPLSLSLTGTGAVTIKLTKSIQMMGFHSNEVLPKI